MKTRKLFLAMIMCAMVSGVALRSNAQELGGSPLSMLKGNYSGIFSGYLVANPLQPLAGTGLFISDGNGNISGHESFNLNGNACDYTLKGTYTVNSDGTGTDDIQFINGAPGCPNGVFTQSLVVVDGGDLILLSNTNSPDVATEHWYRMNPSPIDAEGACCVSHGRCSELSSQACVESDGDFQGAGVSCRSSPCSR